MATKDVFYLRGIDILSYPNVKMVVVDIDRHIDLLIGYINDKGISLADNKRESLYGVYSAYLYAVLSNYGDTDKDLNVMSSKYTFLLDDTDMSTINTIFCDYDKEKYAGVLSTLAECGISIKEGYEGPILDGFAHMTKGLISFMKDSMMKSFIESLVVKNDAKPGKRNTIVQLYMDNVNGATFNLEIGYCVQDLTDKEPKEEEVQQTETPKETHCDDEDEWGEYGVDF